MSIKHVILGILSEAPQHGYSLKSLILPSLDPSKSKEAPLNDGVLYPLLSKMEQEGLIRKKIEKGDKTPDRKIFSITPQGKKVFLEWLRSSEEEGEEIVYDFMKHQPFLAKCTFLKNLTDKERSQKLLSYRERIKIKLKRMEEIKAGMQERKVDELRILILELGIFQQRAKLQWIEKFIKTI